MRTTPPAAATAVLALALALTGCASGAGQGGADDTEETTMSDISGEWQLTKASDAEGAMSINGVPVTLAVHGAEVAGQGPCNGYSGAIETDGDEVAVGALVQTRMACTDDRRSELERRYIAALESVTESRLGAETLTLSGPDVALRFTLLPKKGVR